MLTIPVMLPWAKTVSASVAGWAASEKGKVRLRGGIRIARVRGAQRVKSGFAGQRLPGDGEVAQVVSERGDDAVRALYMDVNVHEHKRRRLVRGRLEGVAGQRHRRVGAGALVSVVATVASYAGVTVMGALEIVVLLSSIQFGHHIADVRLYDDPKIGLPIAAG